MVPSRSRPRTWKVHFTAVAPLHATVARAGEVAGIFEAEGEQGKVASGRLLDHAEDGVGPGAGLAVGGHEGLGE